MCLLIESVRISNGKPVNLDYHNKRFNKTREVLFGITDTLDLADFISQEDFIPDEVYKCRIIYGLDIERIDCELYKPRVVRSLRMVQSDAIEYDFKYADRSAISELFSLRGVCDDILIIRKGLVTDVSYGNVAFYDGKIWHTPFSPLLKGTRRQFLIDNGLIEETKIGINDVKSYRRLAIINSMLDLGDLLIDIEDCIYK